MLLLSFSLLLYTKKNKPLTTEFIGNGTPIRAAIKGHKSACKKMISVYLFISCIQYETKILIGKKQKIIATQHD